MDNLCLLTVLPFHGQSLSSSSVLGYCIPWQSLSSSVGFRGAPAVTMTHLATHSSFRIHLKAFSNQHSQPFCSSFALDIHNLWIGSPRCSKFYLPECFAGSVSPCRFNFSTTQWCKTVLHNETRQHSTMHMISFCCSLLLFRGFVYYTVCFLWECKLGCTHSKEHVFMLEHKSLADSCLTNSYTPKTACQAT